jgi:pimeloyl-ACP methyl ester carboxylesterase
MATYVLVPGAWLGGWAWQPIARQLRDRGHDVYPVTLTGLGDRVHLASPQVGLDTYLADVVNLIEAEDLHDLVLLGHSYAGIVVTGVADRLPERIAQVVYLDSGPAPDGASFLDTQEQRSSSTSNGRWPSTARAGGCRCPPSRSWNRSSAPAWPGSATSSAR